MTKQDEWIHCFVKNCEKIEERAKQGCKESKKFIDDMKKKQDIDNFDLPFWAEKAHMQVAILAAKDFAEGIKEWGEACKRGDSDAAESALSRMLNVNPEELSAFSDIVEENTGKPSAVRDIIPLISSNNSNQLVKSKSMNLTDSQKDVEMKDSHPQTDIADLKEDAATVAEAFGRGCGFR